MVDALEAKFDVFDVVSELCDIEWFHDYIMVVDRPMVEQTYQIQSHANRLEYVSCKLPDNFVVGHTIAKLLPYRWDYATSLKR